MINGLNILAKDIHLNAKEHGWWDEKRSFAEIIALCHSELSEALEAFRCGEPMIWDDNGKPEGIAVELIDCIIRILDYFGKQKVNVEKALEMQKLQYHERTLPELVTHVHYLLSGAYEREGNWIFRFCTCIIHLDQWLSNRKVDVQETINLKHEYNKTRPYKHGGKVI